jgi:hypothetical protein
MATKSLAELLSTFSFLNLTADNKIFCDITKHEMPPKADIVMGHINGKKFKKTMEWYSYDYSEFEPYIVVDRQNSNKLHCKLTGMTLNKIPNEVKKHASGKKYLRLVLNGSVCLLWFYLNYLHMAVFLYIIVILPFYLHLF